MKTQILIVANCLLLAGCRAPEPAVTENENVLSVSVAAGRLTAPDTVAAGWTRLRVEEDGEGHIVVAFQLPANTSESRISSFLAALDTARMTPQPGVAIGGPEVGDTGQVIVHLEPGRYLLGCLRRGEEDQRHASQGEARLLEVTASAGASPPPEATREVRMVDFAYLTETTWAAGRHLIRVENNGLQDHQLRVDRLRQGATLGDWINAEDPGALAEPVAGVARTGPGQAVYLPVDLSPGVYVIYCLIPDAGSGRLHVEMGMMGSITVE